MAVRLCDIEGCVAPHKAKGLCQKHYNATPEQRTAVARWAATDKGRAAQAAYHSRYVATGKGKAAILESAWASGALGRATKAGAVIGNVPPDTRAILRERFGETCLVVGCDNAATDVDHVIALANGGVHDISNFQTLCGSCNSAKGAKGIDYRPAI
jgi:hypothetical protein